MDLWYNNTRIKRKRCKNECQKTLIELLKEYKNEFKEEPAENATQQAFREGIIFAIRLAIIKLEEVEKETKVKQEDD